jgi:hypothetical protein
MARTKLNRHCHAALTLPGAPWWQNSTEAYSGLDKPAAVNCGSKIPQLPFLPHHDAARRFHFFSFPEVAKITTMPGKDKKVAEKAAEPKAADSKAPAAKAPAVEAAVKPAAGSSKPKKR